MDTTGNRILEVNQEWVYASGAEIERIKEEEEWANIVKKLER